MTISKEVPSFVSISVAFRKELPRSGKIGYDIWGMIIGNLFFGNNSSYNQWSRQLAIVYHILFGTRITISDGSPMRDVPGIENPGNPDVWWVKGNKPAPQLVGVAEALIKYELIYPADHRDTEEYIDALRPV